MSRSRPGGSTHSNLGRVSTRALTDLAKFNAQASGTDGRVAPPSKEAMRKFIEAGTCPWCGAGPYKVLATHTGRAHGVDGHELRELAGLTKFASICSPEYAAAKAAALAGKKLPDHAYGEGQRKRRTLSEAGRESQRAKAAKVSQADRERAARISGDKQMSANAEKYAEAVRLFGEGMPPTEIGKRVGLQPPTVVRALKRAGVYVDGRKRRWVNPERNDDA